MTRKGKSSTIAKSVFFVFVVYSIFTLISLQFRLMEKEKEINALENEVKSQSILNQSLDKQIEESTNTENVAQIAREELGFVMPGERVFIDTSSK